MFDSNFKLIHCLLLLVLTINTSTAKDGKPLFSLNDLSEARSLASKDGKMIIVDFCASWCKPCQWMEKTTFANEKVKESLNTNFVTVKIDIDELQGFELKKIYDIKFLPTILVFNSKGELLDRLEQTMSPHKFLLWMETYNTPNNKNIVKHKINISPSENTEPDNNQSNTNNEVANNTKYIADEKSKPSYKVQVGVFSSYEVAEDMVKNMKRFFAEPVSVIYEYEDNIPIFKVRVGQFFKKEEADYFKEVIKKEYNLEGIVI